MKYTIYKRAYVPLTVHIHTIACKTTDLKNFLLNFQAFINTFPAKVFPKVQDIILSLRTSYLMFINYI